MRFLLLILTCATGFAQNPIDLMGMTQLLYPSNVPGLKMWLDAGFGAYTNNGTNLCVDGERVQWWVDKSGNGNTVQNGTPSTQPQWNATKFNGFPAVNFWTNASCTGLTNEYASATYGPWTFFCAAQSVLNPPDSIIWDSGGINSGSGKIMELRIRASASNDRLRFSAFGTAASYMPNYGDLMIVSARVSQERLEELHSAKISTLYVSTVGTGFSTNRVNIVGCSAARAAAARFYGWVAEFIVYEGYLTESQTLGILMYLKQKYNIINPI